MIKLIEINENKKYAEVEIRMPKLEKMVINFLTKEYEVVNFIKGDSEIDEENIEEYLKENMHLVEYHNKSTLIWFKDTLKLLLKKLYNDNLIDIEMECLALAKINAKELCRASIANAFNCNRDEIKKLASYSRWVGHSWCGGFEEGIITKIPMDAYLKLIVGEELLKV